MWKDTCEACGRDVPNGLKKKQLEVLVGKDERDSCRERNSKRNRRDRCAATRVMLKCGPAEEEFGEFFRGSCSER